MCHPRPARTSRFNPRAHAGRDAGRSPMVITGITFQPTRPRGARPSDSFVVVISAPVSTHAPTRGATAHGEAGDVPVTEVSTHAPTRGATARLRSWSGRLSGFQPTRPRGARLSSIRQGALDERVSTHAPTRGATWQGWLREDLPGVSTHAPTRGATARVAFCDHEHGSFNPRAHAGRDQHRPEAPVAGDVVSTHAPTRGATWAAPLRDCGPRCFNPRAHAGRDPLGMVGIPASGRFQPTRPRGARRQCGRCCPGCCCVSTHAPTRGATASRGSAGNGCGGFNPRAHAGRDAPVISDARGRWSFNPRAHAGRDGAEASSALTKAGFQPTRPRGARPACARPT